MANLPKILDSVLGCTTTDWSGLLEALAEKTILSLSDPDDLDGDGISGRPNYIWNQEKDQDSGVLDGKANQPSSSGLLVHLSEISA